MSSMETLKKVAIKLAGDEIEWFKSETSGNVIGIDWTGEDVYILDPQSPDWPQVEIAQFSGIDPLFSLAEEK